MLDVVHPFYSSDSFYKYPPSLIHCINMLIYLNEIKLVFKYKSHAYVNKWILSSTHQNSFVKTNLNLHKYSKLVLSLVDVKLSTHSLTLRYRDFLSETIH